MADNYDTINQQLQALSEGLLADGVKADDISGPIMSQSIALLISSDGRKPTAKHLRDLARRIEEGEDLGQH